MERKYFTFEERTVAQQKFAEFKRTHRVIKFYESHFDSKDLALDKIVGFGFVKPGTKISPQIHISKVEEKDYIFIYWN